MSNGITRQELGTPLNEELNSINYSIENLIDQQQTSKSDFNQYTEVTESPTGFPNRVDSTFSFDSETRTFTIEPVGEAYEVFFRGKKFEKNTSENVTFPDTTALFFVYFDSDGVLSFSTDFPGLQNMIYISYIYWNSNNLNFVLGDERHGTVMDKATHERLHAVDWTQWVRGLQLYGYTMNDSDSSDGLKVSITDGVVADEDLFHNISHSPTPSRFFEQVLQGFAMLPVMYRGGSNGDWNQDMASEYPFKNTENGRINYNEYDENNGTWKQTEVADNGFVAYYVVFGGDVNEPIKIVQGQRIDASLADAQTNNDDRNILWGNMPFEEFKILYRLIFQTSDSFANEKKAMLVDVLDLRAAKRSPGGGGIVPSSHNNLTGPGLSYEESNHTGFASSKDIEDLYVHIDDVVNTPNYSAPQTDTSPVIPLSNSEYGKLKYTLKGRTYTNIVENGDFKDGASGWSGTAATISAANNVMSVLANGTSVFPNTQRNLKAPVVAGKKYFVCAKARVTNSVAEYIRLFLAATDTGLSFPDLARVESPAINTWYEIYRIVTVPSARTGNLRIGIQHSYPDAATANGKIMEVQEVMALDLDQYPDLQGLTAEEINAQIPSYIDGMQSVENVKMVSVGKNLFDITKSNTIVSTIPENAKLNILDLKNNTLETESLNVSTSGYGTRIKCKPDTYYTVSCNALQVQIGYINISSSKSWFGNRLTINSLDFKTKTFKTDINQTYIEIAFSKRNTDDVNMILQNIQLEQGTTPTSYEPYKESTMYLPVPLRQLPNGVADTLDNEGNYVRRTEEYVLKEEDVTTIYTSNTHVDAVIISLSTLNKIKNHGLTDILATKMITSVSTPRNEAPMDDINSVWKHYINPGNWAIIVPKGTYANLAEARTALAGTKVIYELAEPITQKLNIPPVTSFKDGTLMFENKRKYILQADDVANMYTLDSNADYARVQYNIFDSLVPIYGSYTQNYVFNIKGKVPTTNANNVTEIGKYYASVSLGLCFVFPKGTTLAQAKEQLAGLEIEYETVPFPLPEVEYSYPVNLAASVQGNTEMVAQLSREIGDLWFTLLPLADKELAMGLVAPLTTETTADLKSKINQILDIWT